MPLPDYREDNIMPDSPESKGNVQSSISSTNHGGPLPLNRDLSHPLSGINGSHSPVSVINGRTPSPTTMANNIINQQLPPACGARQLSKLKRFLTTLQQFGSDISPEIGERVRTLVLGLVNSHLSIEEFHSKLQEATNFPLRPFVIPFLKANLPLLQRELLHCARMAKQTPQQYLAQNEHILFDATHSPIESQDFTMAEINENGKRRSPDRPKENGLDSHIDAIHPAKRHHPLSPRVSPNGVLNLNSGPIRLEDISLSRELRERERADRERSERERLDRERDTRERHYSPYGNFSRTESFEPLERIDDDWRHVDTMLSCIIGMVDKTKRALAVLQERSVHDREELSMWMRRQAEGMDQDTRKRTNDMMAHTIRQTEDRVSEVRRRAEEAVNEVKRQAMMELQKAVTSAEQKATELVATERAKMDRALAEARTQARDEILSTLNHQEESSESCWNCGRKASETCSGCNIARYCGSFCQHKDWENHHHVCGKTQMAALTDSRDKGSTTAVCEPPRATQLPVTSSPPATPSPTNSAASAQSRPASRSSTPVENRTPEASH
ncbi:hypothetical protein ScPMuIL_001134 [Solemya velum]